jgi:hypothetical protein
MKKQTLQEMKQKVLAGKMVLSPNVRTWGGADVLIVEPSQKAIEDALKWLYESESAIPEHLRVLQADDVRFENGLYIQCRDMHLLITKQARELSAILESMKRLFADVIDFANKYEFYGRLAAAAGSAFGKADVRIAMIDEAMRMVEELQAGKR